jgi:FdhD protein
MQDARIAHISVVKVNADSVAESKDVLAAEEPLEIRLEYGPAQYRMRKSVSVTMRTPGNDSELATGFLFTEDIVKERQDVKNVEHLEGSGNNIITVQLEDNVLPEIHKLERHFYTSSSCGVCGKASIDAVRTVCKIPAENNIRFPAELLYKLPEQLKEHQDIFGQTGGLHASALFDLQGNLLFTREDVGRHNAVDKLIGTALEKDMLPLNEHVLLLSGRASFELIQKAAMAGIRIVAAVGAPSSLAVKLADEQEITLIGFLRDKRFNIYTGAERIIVNSEITTK